MSTKNETKITERKILPHEEIIGGSLNEPSLFFVKRPDGSTEYVRDLEREREAQERVKIINDRRRFLAKAMSTRVVSEAELNEVLELGVEVFEERFIGMRVHVGGISNGDRERKEFLFLLSTQMAIRKLIS